MHKINYSDLDTVQSLHALEFLNPENENDIDTALNFLSGDNLELRFPSAGFLQKTGLLGEMLNSISFKDSVEMERKTNLLLNAAEVKITGFLKDQNYTPATLYTALSILKKAGNREFISSYADKVFQSDTEIDKRIWETAVKCIKTRGDENAFIILIKELNKVKYNTIKANFILENLPEDILIPELFKILQGGREVWSHRIRISALQVLAKYKLPYCIQPIIEQLPTLPVKEAKEFSALLTDFAGETFNNRVFKLLKQPDGKVRAAIIGLSKSDQNRAVDILIDIIDQNDALSNNVIKALADKPSKKTLSRIIENMKDATPILRDKMMAIFKLMGESGEEALKKLLSEDIVSLKEPITKILEDTGYVERVIRKLSHRDPQIRRKAAEFLSILGTKSAFRGIVLAARDPDQDVRVQVIRALEKLNSKSGEEILEALKNDPDKRVRKFTMWAMSRTRAKKIED